MNSLLKLLLAGVLLALALHLKDLAEPKPDSHDVPWGQGCGDMDQVLRVMQAIYEFFSIERLQKEQMSRLVVLRAR